MQGFAVGDPRKTGKVRIKNLSLSDDKLPLVITAMDDLEWKPSLVPVFVKNDDGCIFDLQSANASVNQLCPNDGTQIDMKVF